MYREEIEIHTTGRGTTAIASAVDEVIARSGIGEGLCTIFVHHTSASLIVCENADPTVRADLEAFFARLVPDGDAIFRHTAEGPDDMPSHVRSVLTQTSLTVPIRDGRCDLGTWQGLYLWEHRARGHRRRVSVVVLGERRP
jgi:secondary thiamine-phosphate synthase enzyme